MRTMPRRHRVIATIGPSDAIVYAEGQLKDAIRRGLSSADLEPFEAAVVRAKRAAADHAERAGVRDRLAVEVAQARRAEEKAQKLRDADAAEQAMSGKAPSVVIEYEGLRVRVALLGGRDHGKRLTIEHALNKAVRMFASMFSDDVHAARTLAMGHPAPAPRDKDFIRRLLADELRYLFPLHAVEIEETR